MNYNDYLNKQAEKIAQICKEGATTQEIESKISNGLQGSFIMSQIREEITHAINTGKIVKAGTKVVNEWGTQMWVYMAA